MSTPAIHIDDRGEGLPIVFVHGFTTTSRFWEQQLPALEGRYRVVRLDLPGHGRSPAPADGDYTVEGFAEVLDAVFRERDLDGAVLFGLSMGGSIAIRFAARDPGRLRGLALVGATACGFGPDVQEEEVLASIERLGVEAASQAVIHRSFGTAANAALVEWAAQEVTQTPRHVAEQAVRSLNRFDGRGLLGAIAMPAWVVCGTEDVITPPSESRYLAQHLPDATLDWIESAGHFPMLEQPARFNACMAAFLQRVEAAR